MTLQTSGQMSMTDIKGEFGGVSPDSIDEYYWNSQSVPGSGEINFSDFRGAGPISSGVAAINSTSSNADDAYFGGAIGGLSVWTPRESGVMLTFTTPDTALPLTAAFSAWDVTISGWYNHFFCNWATRTIVGYVRNPAIRLYQGSTLVASKSLAIQSTSAGGSGSSSKLNDTLCAVPAMAPVSVAKNTAYSVKYACDFYKGSSTSSCAGSSNFQFNVTNAPTVIVEGRH